MASGGITGTPDAEPAMENSHKPGARSSETPAASTAVAEIARARPVLKAALLTDAFIPSLLSRSSIVRRYARAGQTGHPLPRDPDGYRPLGCFLAAAFIEASAAVPDERAPWHARPS
jgi:hypothetical protein